MAPIEQKEHGGGLSIDDQLERPGDYAESLFAVGEGTLMLRLDCVHYQRTMHWVALAPRPQGTSHAAE